MSNGAYGGGDLNYIFGSYATVEGPYGTPITRPELLQATIELEASIEFSVGGSRKGFGSRTAHKAKREARATFEDQIAGVKALAKVMSGAVYASAKATRDALLAELNNGTDGSQDNLSKGYVRNPPDMTLQQMRGEDQEGLPKRLRMLHPYQRNAPWFERLSGVFRRQGSNGSGNSSMNPTGGVSIFDYLTAVDDDAKKVYSIGWSDRNAAYIYHQFLVAGTSKMVPRDSLFDHIGKGLDLRTEYANKAREAVTEAIKDYKTNVAVKRPR